MGDEMIFKKKYSNNLSLIISSFFIASGLLFAMGNDHESGFKVFPSLQVVTPDSVGIVWKTFNPDVGVITISLYPNMKDSVTHTTSSNKLHKIKINGLSANTRYYYQLTSDGEKTEINSFITALQKGSRDPFRFIVYGDTRQGAWYEQIIMNYGDNDDHLSICESIMSYAPDFLVLLGDLVKSGTSMSDIYNFFDVEKDLLANYPVLTVYGNHEFRGNASKNNTKIDSYLIPAKGGAYDYYSYNYGNVHILVINTGQLGEEGAITAPGTPQYEFISSDLNTASIDPDLDHIFVTMHCPLYSKGSFCDNKGLIQNLEPLFYTYGVRAVLYGHEHNYMHLRSNDGIEYFLTGGGGSPILDMVCFSTEAEVIEYHQVLNYLIINVDGTNVDIEARSVQGNGNSTSAVLENISL